MYLFCFHFILFKIPVMKTTAIFFIINLLMPMPQLDSLNVDSLTIMKADKTMVDTTHVKTIDAEPAGDLIAGFNQFPSLHPIIVHFAIVLILVAAVMQIINIFLLRKELEWIIAFFLFCGLIAGIIAGGRLHPHTIGLSNHAMMVLSKHDQWAELTIITSSIALSLHAVHLFFVRRSKRLVKAPGQRIRFDFRFYRGLAVVIAIILIAATFCVLRTGHYGAQLVHIEGVGPQGRFLESEH
jgi:uncharacterized membrane protein